MLQTLQCEPGKETYEAVINAVFGLREQNRNGLITIVWPTSSAALFMRRRLMHDLNGTFAIRNTSSNELLDLLESNIESTSAYKDAKTFSDWSFLADIAREVFPGSPWRKLKQVQKTLEILCQTNENNLQYIESNFEQAFKIYEIYRQKSGFRRNNQSKNKNLEHVVGDVIIVTPKSHSYQTIKLSQVLNSTLSTVINYSTNNTQRLPARVYDNPFTEIDNVLSEISKDPQIDFSNTAIVVPNTKYKRALLSYAKITGLPMSGNSANRYSDHKFIEFTKAILDRKRKDETLSKKDIVENVPWLNKESSYYEKSIIEFVDLINQTFQVGKLINIVVDFINRNFNHSFFDGQEEITQSIYEILDDFKNIEPNISVEDAIFVLDLITSKPIRGNSLGEGIYVALPNELEGAYLEHLYILGAHDKYVRSKQIDASFIHVDQYKVLGFHDRSDHILQSQNQLSWLLNSANNTICTTTEINFEGKMTAYPTWICLEQTRITQHKQPVPHEGYDVNEMFAFIQNQLSEEPNVLNTKMSHDINHISATAIERLAVCPQKYFLNNILKVREDQKVYNTDYLAPIDNGNLLHKMLETYYVEKLNEEELRKRLKNVLNEAHEKNELPSKASVELNYIEVSKFLDTFFELDANSLADETEVERKVEGTIKVNDIDIKIKGSIDRLDHYKDKVKIIDYKTSKKNEKQFADFYKNGRRIQLAIYAYLLKEMKNTNGEYWYLHEDLKSIDDQSFSEDELERAMERISRILTIFQTRNFPARTVHISANSKRTLEEDNCDNCSYNRICLNEYKESWEKIKLTSEYKDYCESVGVPSDE